LPLELDDDFLEDCRKSIPELPDAKRKRYELMGLSAYNGAVLTAEVETASWFDALLSNDVDPKQASNWVVAELFGALNRLGVSIAESPVSPAHAAGLLKLVSDGTISGTIAKTVFEKMLESGDPADAIVERRASSRPATPARSMPRSTRSSSLTPTRSSSTRRASSSCSASSSGRP